MEWPLRQFAWRRTSPRVWCGDRLGPLAARHLCDEKACANDHICDLVAEGLTVAHIGATLRNWLGSHTVSVFDRLMQLLEMLPNNAMAIASRGTSNEPALVAVSVADFECRVRMADLHVDGLGQFMRSAAFPKLPRGLWSTCVATADGRAVFAGSFRHRGCH